MMNWKTSYITRSDLKTISKLSLTARKYKLNILKIYDSYDLIALNVRSYSEEFVKESRNIKLFNEIRFDEEDFIRRQILLLMSQQVT